MKKVSNKIPVDNNIVQVPFDEVMPDNYLPYAVEVARDRALPDVRDGLKPVHRRIIYGAYLLKAFFDRPYYKSARIVGDVLGKFHPHGDTSVYDAMVILAQKFSTRMPLIDGQGNWGSEDGDNAAAMRYTEARLTPISMELIRDIDKEVVDMVDNYSGTEKEPVVLPSRYPNLLVNGSFGIAVGLATNIPPHNLGETIDGTIALIDNKDITTEELMKYIKAPDLPTGGIVIGRSSILNAYETGEGKVCQRAKASIEKLENGRLGIVITEFTYRKSKARILQSISTMTQEKKSQKILEPISDIRDESDREGVRAVIEFKKSATEDECQRVLKYLYKKTDLQINIPFNMVAIVNGKPKTLTLKEILEYYIEHQKEVITRRTTKELENAKRRFHIVEGFIKAIGVLDEVLKTIRESKSRKDAFENLIKKFSFTEIQTNAILELMLYRLTGLEIKIFQKEYDELAKKIAKLEKILKEDKELLKVIKKELLEIKEKYDSPRMTRIIEEDDITLDADEFIVDEDVIVTMSNEGYIKRVPLKSYNRTSANASDIEYREGDFNRFLFQCNTKDTIIVFTSKGNMYQLKVKDISEFKWKERGNKIDEIIRSDLKDESYVAAFSISDFNDNSDLYFITSLGMFKKVPLIKFSTSYTKILGIKLRENDELVSVKVKERNNEAKNLTLKTNLGLKFNVKEPVLEPMERNILGFELIKVSRLNSISDFEFSDEDDYKEFGIELIGDKIKVHSAEYSDKKIVKTDSLATILLCDSKGIIYKFPSYIIQNTDEVSVEKLLSLEKDVEIISIFSISSYEEEISLISVTCRGFVKRTSLSEFKECGFSAVFHKFKLEDDKIISCFLSYEIKGNITLITNKGNRKTIKMSDIKFQNRSGIGSNLFVVVFDERITRVLFSNKSN
ncbi:MAG: DNA topoisomerase 4 subunit A [Oscillospiraceae bacterium]|nr:DNA topoisomerase 4 subunit A [Oscillospiraceae bacterium]